MKAFTVANITYYFKVTHGYIAVTHGNSHNPKGITRCAVPCRRAFSLFIRFSILLIYLK